MQSRQRGGNHHSGTHTRIKTESQDACPPTRELPGSEQLWMKISGVWCWIQSLINIYISLTLCVFGFPGQNRVVVRFLEGSFNVLGSVLTWAWRSIHATFRGKSTQRRSRGVDEGCGDEDCDPRKPLRDCEWSNHFSILGLDWSLVCKKKIHDFMDLFSSRCSHEALLGQTRMTSWTHSLLTPLRQLYPFFGNKVAAEKGA